MVKEAMEEVVRDVVVEAEEVQVQVQDNPHPNRSSFLTKMKE